MDKVTHAHVRGAVMICGYDFDCIMGSHVRTRLYSDIRAIVWAICASETGDKPKAIADWFGRDRSTVACAIMKANGLRGYDKGFTDLYDAIYGYYMTLESSTDGIEEYDAPAAQGVVEREA